MYFGFKKITPKTSGKTGSVYLAKTNKAMDEPRMNVFFKTKLLE